MPPSARRVVPTLAALLAFAGQASAQIDLELVATYPRSSPFGLAWDGTNIWWSNSSGTAFEMSTGGVDTGASTAMPNGWSELAWDASRNQLVSKGISSNQVVWYDRYTAANQIQMTVPHNSPSLNDGLDVDGGELWSSPDVSFVYRYAIDYATMTLAPTADGNPFLGGAGGYSGVERVNVGPNSYVIVVNDAQNPRRLCVHELNKTELGCENFVNQRYEGLAFDGRYLWAADYFGHKIDKFDVKGQGGGSIFVPPSSTTPEPISMVLLGTGLAGLAAMRRRRRRTDTDQSA